MILMTSCIPKGISALLVILKSRRDQSIVAFAMYASKSLTTIVFGSTIAQVQKTTDGSYFSYFYTCSYHFTASLLVSKSSEVTFSRKDYRVPNSKTISPMKS